jgi:isopropylmalate/homocitrate/citramalate synthase
MIDHVSRRDVLRRSLYEMDIELSPPAFEQAFARMEEITHRHGAISSLQIRAIVDEALAGIETLNDVATSFR